MGARASIGSVDPPVAAGMAAMHASWFQDLPAPRDATRASPRQARDARSYRDGCGEHHVVAFSRKARAVRPSCLAGRMSAGTRIWSTTSRLTSRFGNSCSAPPLAPSRPAPRTNARFSASRSPPTSGPSTVVRRHLVRATANDRAGCAGIHRRDRNHGHREDLVIARACPDPSPRFLGSAWRRSTR